MPELPEVETTCQGIRPHILHKRIESVTVRERRLRWPVDERIDHIAGLRIEEVSRRAKYILIRTSDGATVIIHLGMSGSMRICRPDIEWRPHDHLALTLDSGMQLRYHDPRRFGCWLWTNGDPMNHKLLANLGPEPLGKDFNTGHMVSACKNRSVNIKQLIMNSSVVVGVGNIYASEALFASGIHPKRKASRISVDRLKSLTSCIKRILDQSIRQGGTTLRDFVNEQGQPGYFKQRLMVYDREGDDCRICSTPIKRITLGQRSTYYCPDCQK